MGTLLKEDRTDPAPLVGRILVVDDDLTLRECTSEILAACGFDIVEARDGLEALEKYEAQHGAISLVLMDITMPRLDGIEAAKQMRAIDPLAKIILSSGYADQTFADAHPDAFLPKPYPRNALREVVQRVLQSECIA